MVHNERDAAGLNRWSARVLSFQAKASRSTRSCVAARWGKAPVVNPNHSEIGVVCDVDAVQVTVSGVIVAVLDGRFQFPRSRFFESAVREAFRLRRASYRFSPWRLWTR